MKKSYLLTVVLTLALCLLLAIPVFAETKPLNPGETVTGTFTQTDTEFEYTMELPSCGRLVFNVHNENVETISCSISQGSSFSQGGYAQIGDTQFYYELDKGVYTIKLHSYDAGNFSLQTEFISTNETYPDVNNQISDIKDSAALPFKEAVTGFLAQNDNKDWFKLVLPSSGKLSLPIHSDIETLSITLRDSSETVIISDYMNVGDKTIDCDLAAGTYYLCFNQISGYGAFSFTPSLKSAGETYSYANNSANEVRTRSPIPFSTVIKGQIALNDDADYFKVTIPKKGSYTIKLTGTMETIYFGIRDKNDSYIADYFHNQGTALYKVTLSKGVHYFSFKQFSGRGNFNFKIYPTGNKISKLTKGSKSMQVKWTKGTGDGYQIQYSLKKSFKGAKTVTIKKASTLSKTIKKLKAQKTYYVRVRVFVKADGGKIYSNWSQFRKVKIAK